MKKCILILVVLSVCSCVISTDTFEDAMQKIDHNNKVFAEQIEALKKVVAPVATATPVSSPGVKK